VYALLIKPLCAGGVFLYSIIDMIYPPKKEDK
jgi:hypothetical protein